MADMVIRDARLEDAADILSIYAYYVENTAISFEYVTPTLSEFTQRMQQIKEKFPYLVVEQDGKIQGYAYAAAFRSRPAYGWNSEVTIYLRRDIQKCGAGRKLYAALEEKLRTMGITNCYACIAYPAQENPYVTANSADFHTHVGYQQVGRFHKCGYKFGHWFDMVYMEKFIGTHSHAQPDVKSYRCL